MAREVIIYDPTAGDLLSKVRGIGRYMQILRESFEGHYRFTSELEDVAADSVFVNPFLNPIRNPLITRRVARKQIAVIHDVIPLKYPTYFPLGIRGKFTVFRNRRTLRLYDLFLTDSEKSKKDIVKILGIPAKKIVVVHPCLPEDFESYIEVPLPHNVPANYFLYVGDITWNKNIAMIARAVRRADTSCVFVGKAFATMEAVSSNPWLDEFRHFVKEVQDDPRFIFPGYIDNETLKSLYTHAVANILISHDEGFGFSYIEAASQKTPSILSDIPVFREIAGEHAVFVNHTDEESVAQAIRMLAGSPKERRKIGVDAYRAVDRYRKPVFRETFQSIVGSL